MTSFELVLAGWIAPTAVRTVIGTARSYLVSNYDRHKKTREMLDDLEINLPRVELAVKMAEQQPSQSEVMGQWLKSLKLAISKAEDVLDDFEGEAIREKLKGKGKVREFVSSSYKTVKKTMVPDKDLEKLEETVGKIQEVYSGIGKSLKIMELENKNVKEESTHSKETSSLLSKDKKIFGRDKEIELIVNMILGYDPFYDPKPESKKGETSSKFPGFDIIPRFGKPVLKMVTWRTVPIHPPKRPLGYGESESSQEKTKIPDVHSSEQNVPTHVSPTHVEELGGIEVNSWSLGVLPIVGTTGVGKTTLAQIIFNNQIVKEKIPLQSWVYVSDIFDPKKLIENIIFSFNGFVDHNRSLDYVQNKLVGIIKNKKFFLVLDDVWDNFLDPPQSTWTNILLPVLREGAPGSVVLVTTQSQVVAEAMRTLPQIKLDYLPLEYFWPLFEHHAFGDKEKDIFLPSNKDEISELESIGKEIVKKLRGIPLEAEIIGKLLNHKLDTQHWRGILESDWWKAPGASKYILPSLGIGYRSLNSVLKQSFLYCSIFPKGYIFEKNRLVEMWISHGFIRPTESEEDQIERREKRLEDIGNERFEMLVNRFFFQPTVWKDKYHMHDFIRDLAVAISSNEFCIINNDSEPIPKYACHVALNNENLETNFGDSNYETLRTLIFLGYSNKPVSDALATSIFKKSGSLRLLDLSYKIIKKREFHDVFTKYSHLRFLDLSFTDVSLLPDSICLLCHLQVLDLRGYYFRKLPKRINELINLRHLYASPHTISLISGIWNLVNLQELEDFQIKPKDGYKINELKNLNEIRGELQILNLGLVCTEKEAIDANLIEKRHLNSLTLEWESSSCGSELIKEIAERLKPPSNLEKLEMKYYPWAYFTEWMVQNKNFYQLRHVKIFGGPLEFLPPFGLLPKLETLSLVLLEYIRKINPEFYGSDEVAFPCLKELDFNNLSEWEDWSSVEGKQIFPHLRKLKLDYCEELKKVPTASWNKYISELSIIYCDGIVKEIEAIVSEMTALTQLTIKATKICEVTIHYCEVLRSVEVLSLENVIVKINTLDGIMHGSENWSIPILSDQLRSESPMTNPTVIDSARCVNSVYFKRPIQSCSANSESQTGSESDSKFQNLEINYLVKLKRLILKGAAGLMLSEPQRKSGLQMLTYIRLEERGMENLVSIGKLPLLQTVSIYRFYSSEFTMELESWFEQQASIEELEFDDCYRLKRIPSAISTLSSLKKLTITSCCSIESLPNRLPENLEELYIRGASQGLVQRCKPEGADWPNISHVPCIRISGLQYPDYYHVSYEI